jgi:hypothetical protein
VGGTTLSGGLTVTGGSTKFTQDILIEGTVETSRYLRLQEGAAFGGGFIKYAGVLNNIEIGTLNVISNVGTEYTYLKGIRDGQNLQLLTNNNTKYEQTSTQTKISNDTIATVGKLTADTGYNVGTSGSNFPLCSYMLETTGNMGIATGSDVNFRVLNNGTYNNTFTRTCFNVLPCRFECIFDNGTLTGTVTGIVFTVKIMNGSTNVSIGTNTQTISPFTSTTAPIIFGTLTGTAVLPSGSLLQTRFSFTLVSGTLTANNRGIKLRTFFQQL